MSEQQIEQWRGFVRNRAELADDDVVELEEHLRGQMSDLIASGLADDEAFLVAVKRMGSVDELSREFAREHSDRLWKQLVLSSADPVVAKQRNLDLWLAIAFGIGAAISVRAGLAWLSGDLFARVLPILALPWLAGYFAWKRKLSRRVLVALVVGFGVTASVLVLYPFVGEISDTLFLTVMHAIVVLWALIGVAYAGGEWRSSARRMDFIRFTGEWAIYLQLISTGGGLLLVLASATFHAVGIRAEPVLGEWVLPMGAAGSVLIAAWLVESKQNVIENIAPVLARVFSPLTVILLVGVLVAFAVNPGMIGVNRDLLILMTVILLLVLALWLYAVSARPPQAPAGLADWLQLVLIVSAIVVDVVVLVVMAARINELGWTPNRAATLGLNIILLVNLLVSAWLGWAFLRGRKPVSALERWQTGYLPVYAAWAAFVMLTWGPLFNWK